MTSDEGRRAGTMVRFGRGRRGARATTDDGPGRVPARFNFTRDVVEQLAADPGRQAITFVDRHGVIERHTFAEVAAEANRWSALLRSRGLAPGDRLLVVLGKSPTWHAVVLGALKAGLVVVPCTSDPRAGELDFRAAHSGARFAVSDSERVTELTRMTVEVSTLLVEDVEQERRAASPLQQTHDTAAGDLAFIFYTSRTTGGPRGVAHTHAFTWAMRHNAEHWLDAQPDDLVWCTHGMGSARAVRNLLLGPWSRGAEVVVHEGEFDAEQRFDLVQRLGVTILCQAPDEYRFMAEVPDPRAFDLHRLRRALSEGTRLGPEVVDAFRAAFGLTIFDGYSQAESAVIVAGTPAFEVKPGSIGLPTPGHDVEVIDGHGNEQPAGVEGELAVRGRPPTLFREYWGAPEATRAAFRGEWYLTGDRAIRDEGGYLWLSGRVGTTNARDATRQLEGRAVVFEEPTPATSSPVGAPDPGGARRAGDSSAAASHDGRDLPSETSVSGTTSDEEPAGDRSAALDPQALPESRPEGRAPAVEGTGSAIDSPDAAGAVDGATPAETGDRPNVDLISRLQAYGRPEPVADRGDETSPTR
jgi:acyl-coenzyme A synthetase/AMP-(fatty) acid ligase